MKIDSAVLSEFTLPDEINLYDASYRPVMIDKYKPITALDLPKTGLLKTVKIKPKLNFTEQSIIVQISESNAAYVNSLRRVIQSELPTLGLTVREDTYKITDPNIDIDKIKDIIMMIPLRTEGIKLDQPITLNIENKDIANAVLVFTRHIKIGNSNLVAMKMCNDMELFHIYPNKAIKLDLEIRSISGSEIGQFSAGFNVGMRPLTKSSVYIENTTYELRFSTNGHISPRQVILDSCKNIINRYQKLADNLESSLKHRTSDDSYEFNFSSETFTLITPITIELTYGAYKDIVTHASAHAGTERLVKLTIKLNNSQDIYKILRDTIKVCSNHFILSSESVKVINGKA